MVAGVANRKSVAYHVGKRLQEAGAHVLWVVHREERRAELAQRLGDDPIFVCDVEKRSDIEALGRDVAALGRPLAGFLHSIAYANYSDGWQPFHRTRKEDFLQAVDVSVLSLVQLADALRASFEENASVVTVSISSTRIAAENYGYMAPVKAALDSAVVFLAKSFAALGNVRFNSVRAGLLKTASSAGIPGYLESYLFAEQLTLRKRALATTEVADTALFLLSPRSAGINAQGIVVDAGMDVNPFDAEVLRKATALEPTPSPASLRTVTQPPSGGGEA